VERCSTLELVPTQKGGDHRLDGARSAQGGFAKSKHDIMGSHKKSDARIGAGEPGKIPGYETEAAPCGSNAS
jgi:hypothetical protein